MSTTDDTADSTDTDDQTGDREVFERLAERFEGDDVGVIAETVLQSFDESEEANS